MTLKLWRMIAALALLGICAACVTPRPDPRKKTTDNGEAGVKPLKAPKIVTWSEDDTELTTAKIYEEVFDFDEKKNEWWPDKALPKTGDESPRLDFMNIGDFIVLKTKNRTKMIITFEPVSRDVIKMGPKRQRVTYFCKIIDVQRKR